MESTGKMENTGKGKRVYLEDPPIARALFSDVRFAWVWVILRVYVGYEWLEAGLEKVGNPAWMSTGEGLKSYWARAVAIPAQGKPPITYDWYRGFLQSLLDSGSYTWFAKLVVFGEIAVGLALILGAFVGIAALFGALMNLNFMLAGSASTNPVLLMVAGLLLLAWKTAGYWGLDRLILPALGTPWHAGFLIRRVDEAAREARPVASET